MPIMLAPASHAASGSRLFGHPFAQNNPYTQCRITNLFVDQEYDKPTELALLGLRIGFIATMAELFWVHGLPDTTPKCILLGFGCFSCSERRFFKLAGIL
jgi:hypothetical protein